MQNEIKKYLWYNDRDIWYSWSDWVVAESVNQCNEILSKHWNCSLQEILNKKFHWSKKLEVFCNVGYVSFQKGEPLIKETSCKQTQLLIEELDFAFKKAKKLMFYHHLFKTKQFKFTMYSLAQVCRKVSQYIDNVSFFKEDKDLLITNLNQTEFFLNKYWNCKIEQKY